MLAPFPTGVRALRHVLLVSTSAPRETLPADRAQDERPLPPRRLHRPRGPGDWLKDLKSVGIL